MRSGAVGRSLNGFAQSKKVQRRSGPATRTCSGKSIAAEAEIDKVNFFTSENADFCSYCQNLPRRTYSLPAANIATVTSGPSELRYLLIFGEFQTVSFPTQIKKGNDCLLLWQRMLSNGAVTDT